MMLVLALTKTPFLGTKLHRGDVMVNKQETQLDAIVAELRAQRAMLADRAANLAAELAVEKAEKAVLEGRLKALEEEE